LQQLKPLLSLVGDWRYFLSLSSEEEVTTFKKHERNGRPLGREMFVEGLEANLSRLLSPQKRGPKPKAK